MQQKRQKEVSIKEEGALEDSVGWGREDSEGSGMASEILTAAFGALQGPRGSDCQS